MYSKDNNGSELQDRTGEDWVAMGISTKLVEVR
jgi:hypothetical protein